jgi:hypothetical protein
MIETRKEFVEKNHRMIVVKNTGVVYDIIDSLQEEIIRLSYI